MVIGEKVKASETTNVYRGNAKDLPETEEGSEVINF